MEVRDNRGRKIGTVGPAYYPGTNCIVTIAVIAAVIGGIVWGVTSLVSCIQYNASLPVHDSLKNTKTLSNCNSDSQGLHLDSMVCWYSNVKYSDVDVSVTAKLTKGGPDAAYGLLLRDFLAFGVTASGKWFYEDSNCFSCFNSIPLTSNSAIHQGSNAPNTLEVTMQGKNLMFFVNGVNVGQSESGLSQTEGYIGFIVGQIGSGQENDTTYGPMVIKGNNEATFTDLSINKD